MELHELTDEEWECFERLSKILCESTPESIARSIQQTRAFVEENGDIFAGFPKGLLHLEDGETG